MATRAVDQIIYQAYRASPATFAQKLDQACAQIGITQSEFGRRANVSKSTVSEYFNGGLLGENASLKTLAGFAAALQRPLALVIEWCGYDLGLATPPSPDRITYDPTVMRVVAELRQLRPDQLESVMRIIATS